MKALIQILTCCLIFVQLHAQQNPVTPFGATDLYAEDSDNIATAWTTQGETDLAFASNQNPENSPVANPAAYPVADAQFRLELANSVPGPTSTMRTYNVYLESLTDEPLAAHGLSFTIDFDNLQIDSISADFSNSSLDPDENSEKFDAENNKLDIEFSRTDRYNTILGNFLVGVIVITDNITSTCPFTTTISDGIVMSGEGETSTIDNRVFSGSPDGSIIDDHLSVSKLRSGTYEADYALDSDATIAAGNAVEFKAGEVIELGMGFSVEPGAVFSSQIQKCGGE